MTETSFKEDGHQIDGLARFLAEALEATTSTEHRHEMVLSAARNIAKLNISLENKVRLTKILNCSSNLKAEFIALASKDLAEMAAIIKAAEAGVCSQGALVWHIGDDAMKASLISSLGKGNPSKTDYLITLIAGSDKRKRRTIRQLTAAYQN
ncbi:MAG: hypothetical protein WCG48_00610 [Candidatus Berkelbacteria bacterium]